jgi:hypothetical protein
MDGWMKFMDEKCATFFLYVKVSGHVLGDSHLGAQ